MAEEPPIPQGLCVCTVPGAVVVRVGTEAELLAAGNHGPRWPMTTTEYARFMGKNPRTVRDWCAAGLLGYDDRPGMERVITQAHHEEFQSPKTRRRKSREDLCFR